MQGVLAMVMQLLAIGACGVALTFVSIALVDDVNAIYTGQYSEELGAAALTIGSVLRGTILNYVIFNGHYRGQPIQQPIQMT